MKSFADRPIVVPIDFSDEADQAVERALEIAAVASGVHLLHVAQPLLYLEPTAIYEPLDDQSRREALLNAMATRFADPKYDGLHFEVRFGDPGTEIVSYASKVNAGLIVLPSHGRTGLAHLLIGSVAERVVRLAKCPVLVLRR